MVWQGENFGIALKALAAAIEPERPALIHGDRVISWRELDEQTDRIAASLRESGVKPGDIAGQMLRNNPDYMLAYFGCIKAGVSPVNVNYHYKERELADIFERFGLKALFVESDFADVAAEAMPDAAQLIDVGSGAWAAMRSLDLQQDFSVYDNPEALFLTATGGTTGMPKAVMWPMIEAWQAFSISVWQRGIGEPPFVATSLEEQREWYFLLHPRHPSFPEHLPGPSPAGSSSAGHAGHHRARSTSCWDRSASRLAG